MREYALVLLVTAAVTYLLIPVVRGIAVRTHAMHAPRARDVHTEPTPLLGGLAMYGGLVAGLLVASRLSFLNNPFESAGSRTQTGLLLAGGLIVVVGFIDDRWGLNAISKLAGQVAAGGLLVWSGQSLPWLPTPNGQVFPLEPDLSVTLTILLVVVTINAINFIDGLDGLAAGIVAVAALSFLAYSYILVRNLGNTEQSLPAVSAAVLAGMCLGFLPHNVYPARIFMGDTGAMLLGLMLAYGPISSTSSLDPALLVNYAQGHAANRFGTILPLLVPAAIFLVPYADLMLAVIRRSRRGKPLMAADREHLHHRLLGIGHSYRQSVLIMWLWAALFSVTVVSLSLGRTHLIILVAATLIAVLALLPLTMPSLRPWRLLARARRRQVGLPVTPRAPRRPASGAAGPARAASGSRAAASGSRAAASSSRAAASGPLPAASGPPPAASGRLPAAAAPRSAFLPRTGHQTGHQTGQRTGHRAASGTGNGGPPPGFDPLPAPAVNGTTPANGSSSIPGPAPAERALRPFPGDTDRTAPQTLGPDPFPASPRPEPR